MKMIYMLTPASLILGLAAWILPSIYMSKYNNIDSKKGSLYIFLSLSACAISIFLQIVYNNYLVEIGDWSALMDTTGALVLVSGTLLGVTLLLNAFAVMKHLKVR